MKGDPSTGQKKCLPFQHHTPDKECGTLIVHHNSTQGKRNAKEVNPSKSVYNNFSYIINGN